MCHGKCKYDVNVKLRSYITFMFTMALHTVYVVYVECAETAETIFSNAKDTEI